MVLVNSKTLEIIHRAGNTILIDSCNGILPSENDLTIYKPQHFKLCSNLKTLKEVRCKCLHYVNPFMQSSKNTLSGVSYED